MTTDNHQITIQGQYFTVTQKYSEGHILTEAEAKALNIVRSENLRNSFASVIKAEQKILGEGVEFSDEAKEVFQTKFAELEASYVFTSKRPQRSISNPAVVIANKLAKELLVSAFRARKIDIKTVTPEKLAELIAGLLVKKPDIMEEAKRRVAALQDAAEDILDI